MRRHKIRNSTKPLTGSHSIIRTDEWYDEQDRLYKTEIVPTVLPYIWYEMVGRREEIWYKTSAARRDNPCEHLKSYTSDQSVTAESPKTEEIIRVKVPYGTSYVYEWHKRIRWYNETIEAPMGSFPVISPFTDAELYSLSLDGALQDHYDKIRNPLGESMSLANFVLELKDLSKLFNQLKTLVNKGKGNLQDGILANEFGIQPLIRDLNSMLDVGSKIQDIKNRMRHAAEAPVTIRTRSHVGIPGRSGGVAYRPPDWSWTAHKYAVWDTSVGDAEVWFVTNVRYDFRTFDNVADDAIRFSKAMGLTNPLKVAYDAIPFTFLLDNVVNVGRMLKKLDLLDQLTRRRIVKTTSHIRMTQTATGFVSGHRNYGCILWKEAGRSHCTRYHRWTGLPPEPSFNFEAPADIGDLYTDMLNAERLYNNYVRKPIDWVKNLL